MRTRGVAVGPRRHIYAFRNVQTNQVLYSLSRTLEPTALNQLPDLGANNKPVSIRRDLWRPFFVVNFGESRSGIAQCQDAYSKLLHFRKLHEYHWERPAELELPHTEEQIDHIREDLESRGGSKKESPYDLIKRYKKKLRVKAIMDQKANSVADLAATLLEQKNSIRHQVKESKKHEVQRKAATIRLANQAFNGGIKALETKKNALKERIPRVTYQESPQFTSAQKELRELEIKHGVYEKRGTRPELRRDLKSRIRRLRQKLKLLQPVSKNALLRELTATKDELKRMTCAMRAVQTAQEEAEIVRTAREQERKARTAEGKRVEEKEITVRWEDYLSTDSVLGSRHEQIVFNMEDITIQWDDERDQSFSERWPEGVRSAALKVYGEHRPPQHKLREAPKPEDVMSIAARQLWRMVRQRSQPGLDVRREGRKTERRFVERMNKIRAGNGNAQATDAPEANV